MRAPTPTCGTEASAEPHGIEPISSAGEPPVVFEHLDLLGVFSDVVKDEPKAIAAQGLPALARRPAYRIRSKPEIGIQLQQFIPWLLLVRRVGNEGCCRAFDHAASPEIGFRPVSDSAEH